MSKTSGKIIGISFFAVLVAFIIFIALIGNGLDFWSSRISVPDHEAPPGRIKVVATLFPYYDMARSLAADGADVSMLLPSGVSPHHYEPKPSDIRLLNEADVFIYSGPSLEPWAEDLAMSVENPDLVIVNASENAFGLLTEEEDGHPGAAHHAHEGIDPHVWLDTDNAVISLNAIRDAMSEADPSTSETYRERALVYEGRLREIDAEYRETFDSCRTHTFVQGGHRSFGYVAYRYHLDYYATTGADDLEEATANELASLSTLVKEKALPYVFYGSFESPRIAEAIARESGSGILPINPAATISKADFDNGKTFSDILEENLRLLSLALECQ
jgi:zinc transport system substrate-binding protein